MTEPRELQVIERGEALMSPSELKQQVNHIQQVMKEVMTDGEHYGIIPGTSGKPSLLKPGAEKLGHTFHLDPEFNPTRTDYPNGHREYEITCTLTHLRSGRKWQGLGSCSTMESRYRYRGSEKTNTGVGIPKDYWEMRKSDPATAQQLLGGKGFSPMKDEGGRWVIGSKGERIENPDIADTYNTVLKIAKKRAHVDAVLTATAASDIFTQDLEDMGPAATSAPPSSQSGQQKVPVESPAPTIAAKAGRDTTMEPGYDKAGRKWSPTEKQRKRLFAIARERGKSIDMDANAIIKDCIGILGLESTSDIPSRDSYDGICQAVGEYRNPDENKFDTPEDPSPPSSGEIPF